MAEIGPKRGVNAGAGQERRKSAGAAARVVCSDWRLGMQIGMLNPLATGAAVRVLLNGIRKQKLKVGSGNNFYRFERHRTGARPDTGISVFFDPDSSSDFHRAALLWSHCHVLCRP